MSRRGLLVLLGVTALLVGAVAWYVGRRPTLPVDSSSPAFTGPADRIAWMRRRIRGSPPSAMRDAHFLERSANSSGGHMVGPGRTRYYFHARIEIDSADGPVWAGSAQKSTPPSRWRRDSNPLHQSGAAWSMAPADFDTAQWYDPEPLFHPRAHPHYEGGYMAINDAGTIIYVWQHWRGRVNWW